MINKILVKLFDENVCWNIFDHTTNPEILWRLLDDYPDEARRMALRLTLQHPFTMVPLIFRMRKEIAQ